MAIETLRPNAAGSSCIIASQTNCSACPNHFDCIHVLDDAKSVKTSADTYQRDLYALPAHAGVGAISKITVYVRLKADNAACRAKPSFKSNGTTTDGTEITPTGSWVTYSEQWANNPADGAAWEWADIDALEIGVQMHGWTIGPYFARCSEVYVEVDYSSGWTGTISGVTNPSAIMGVDVANIASVKGV